MRVEKPGFLVLCPKIIISIIVFVAVVIGVVALAMSGKKTVTPTEMKTETDTDTSPVMTPPINHVVPETSNNTYKDGTYTAKGSYTSPAGPESITLALTIKDDVVTHAVVTPMATNPKSIRYQGEFTAGINAAVVGKNIDSLSVGKISGSSLTAGGFADAVAKIKAQARS